MKTRLWLLAFVCLCLSCQRNSSPAASDSFEKKQQPSTANLGAPLPATSHWVLDRLNGAELAVAEITGEVPTLTLELEKDGSHGQASGSAGCNRYRGPVDVQGSSITFGHLMSTKVNCPSIALENRFMGILAFGLLHYTYEPGRLTIFRDRRSVLEFKPAKK